MQIQIDIDDELLSEALEASNQLSHEAVIAKGLRMIVVLNQLRDLADVLDVLMLDIEHASRH